jgi:hypothetical protein
MSCIVGFLVVALLLLARETWAMSLVNLLSPTGAHMSDLCDIGDVLYGVPQESVPATITDPKRLVTEYMRRGWMSVTGLYKSGAKSKSGAACVDADALRFLGAVRKSMVTRIFECANQSGGVRMQSFGSDNLTSDFDVTLVGRDACHVMWTMFTTFVRHHGQTLPHAFDTNLYCTGTNSHEHARPGAPVGLERVPFQGRGGAMFSLRPVAGSSGAAASRAWAIAKVVEASRPGDPSGIDLEGVFGSDDVANARSCLERARAVRAAVAPVTAAEYGRELDVDSRAVVGEYALQYHYAALLNAALYLGADNSAPCAYLRDVATAAGRADETIVDLLCLSMYFSIEAAWTCATINVVVLEMQGGVLEAGSGSADDYECAMIETFGDFTTHAESGDDRPADPATVLKLSKYVYRMIYAAAEAIAATGDADLAAELRREARAMNAGVVDRRDSSASPDLDLVYLEPGATADAYRGAIARRFADLYGSVSRRSVSGGAGYARRRQPNVARHAPNVALALATAFFASIPRL